MIFHSDNWVFWAIIAVGLLAYTLIFDALLAVRHDPRGPEKSMPRLQVIEACLAALPLLGLLGTIMGLLQTFAEMAGPGIDTDSLIAGGVGTALGTTQLGLLLAAPGLLLMHVLKRQLEKSSSRGAGHAV